MVSAEKFQILSSYVYRIDENHENYTESLKRTLT